ncbi:putative capsid protein [Pacific flying fox faeces associated circular DNA virus-13]|nr:putative capsid protein [Pacific flying fox faeces associated circular DNA virus-13]
MPRFSRRRRYRRPYRGRSTRSRFRRRLRRRFTGRRKRYFVKKQLVPGSSVARIVMNTPIRITLGTVADSRVGGAWIANSLEGPDFISSTPGLARGQYSIMRIAAGPSETIPIGTAGATMYRQGHRDIAYVYSSNFMHLVRFYRNYRVVKTTLTLSLAYDNRPNSIDQTSGMSRFASVTLFATDDIDSIDTDGDINDKWIRPYAYGHRHVKTKTLHNGHISPSKISMSTSAYRLVKDRTTLTSADYVGSITPVEPQPPIYPGLNSPEKKVYIGFVISPYGVPTGGWPASTEIVSGYLTVTQKVQFFNPHDTADFYGPV